LGNNEIEILLDRNEVEYSSGAFFGVCRDHQRQFWVQSGPDHFYCI
jgi:hypothetical protein